MRSKFLWYIMTAFLLVLGLGIYSKLGLTYESAHPSLNEISTSVDVHLGNIKYYARDAQVNRSLIHLDKAINSIETIEYDVDLKSAKNLEKAISRLKAIKHEMEFDSLDLDQLNQTLIYALNSLALAELRVSEHYAEVNKAGLAKKALEYSQHHLKSALQFADKMKFQRETDLFYRIDSLLDSNKEPDVLELTQKVDYLIRDLDLMVASNE